MLEMAREMQILSIEARPAPYPMRSPFTSAKRSSAVAENVLVTARLSDGTTGYGEASPATYVTGETPATVLAAVPEAAEALAGRPIARYRAWGALLAELLPRAPTARTAVEMALLDALTRSLELPLWQWFGGAAIDVRTDLSIPICPSEQAGATAREAAEAGFRSLKIKVGGPDEAADRERVLAVASGAPGCALRLDANQGFQPEQALAFVRDLLARGVPVEVLEQPVPKEDLEALARVTRASPVPVIADEAVVTSSDALQIARRGAAHGINIKLAKAGLLGALEWIAIARAAGLRLMIGCMLESLLGIGTGVHLACGTGAFDYVDLDAHLLIGLQPSGSPFAQEGDRLIVGYDTPGLGWEPGE
jgi:L-alanine-DL-glutamate epimerase-like enolase superfamily enzyme